MMFSKVYILDYGKNEAESSDLIVGRNPGVKVTTPIIGLYIDHPEGKVLIDTGVEDGESDIARKLHHHHTEQQTPVRQLERLGVKPEQIDYVILTHLHWDHCGCTHHFPKAKIIVRREELEKAFVPVNRNDQVYRREDFDKDLDYHIVPNGLDFELLEGIKVISTPGHSAGMQSILISTKDGNVLYASDAMNTYDNWNFGLLPGICFNTQQQEYTIAKLKTYRDVIFVPSHDIKLDLTKVYGGKNEKI